MSWCSHTWRVRREYLDPLSFLLSSSIYTCQEMVHQPLNYSNETPEIMFVVPSHQPHPLCQQGMSVSFPWHPAASHHPLSQNPPDPLHHSQRRQNIHLNTVSNLQWFELWFIFYFTMVWKQYAFSRKHTLDFEFWPFSGLFFSLWLSLSLSLHVGQWQQTQIPVGHLMMNPCSAVCCVTKLGCSLS